MTTAYLLFVGEPAPFFSPVLEQLKDAGCEVRHAAGCNEALSTIQQLAGPIVLSKTRLSCGSARNLIPKITAASGSLFVYFPVEDGCWWIPMILQGKLCEGEVARHSRDFGKLLLETFNNTNDNLRDCGDLVKIER
jgi:hypothetical protein